MASSFLNYYTIRDKGYEIACDCKIIYFVIVLTFTTDCDNTCKTCPTTTRTKNDCLTCREDLNYVLVTPTALATTG